MAKYATSEQTCEALLDAAGQLAAELGFGNVSTRRIAERAGVNVSGIHYHFGGKDKLFNEVVRRVMDDKSPERLKQLLEPYLDKLDDPQVQAEAVRAIVRFHVELIIDPSKPKWYTRAVYQVLQYNSPHRDYVNDEYIYPSTLVIYEVLQAIKPDLQLEDLVLHVVFLFAPILMHSTYDYPILHSLGREEFSTEYLNKLEKMIVPQMFSLLGIDAQGNRVDC